ncbi:hypothetical protein MAAFP003_5487 [Mycobacterium ahvazicum]|uniref:DUF4226 domain-containing protein n=1 Tax=Mycobacterium ahvazicum TaxID=1964395 RepID=A0A2K4YJ13_9MYCO|nr:DUF4226 domain-containing protein [Mycobacterium ahvazicum]SOX56776.1 hypothetical protein MAAFP003_5487 [Mycobacterium ahvazicum]
MSEQTGPSLAAIQARQSAMATRHDSVAEADRALVDVLASAHAAMRESIRRLDAISDEIERAVPQQRSLGIDTPIGAREFQKFLVAKQREIAAVVADARELDRAKTAVLERLRGEYGVSAG